MRSMPSGPPASLLDVGEETRAFELERLQLRRHRLVELRRRFLRAAESAAAALV
jgi:hypothetical protein